MVLLIIIPIKWLFHWEYTLFSDKPILGGTAMGQQWNTLRRARYTHQTALHLAGSALVATPGA